MRKYWTRICTVALLVVVMFSFTACSLFVDDLDTKYSATNMVANVNNSQIGVSRQELYQTYLQWGYQYASQMEQDELLEYLTEYILNNKILAQISRDKFGGEEKYNGLYASEYALALKNSFEAIDNAIRSNVYEILDMEDPENAQNDEADDTVKYEPYQKTILVETYTKRDENGDKYGFTLDLSNYEDTDGILNPDDYQTYTPNIPGVASEKIAKQAITKIVRNLQSLEKGFTRLAKPTNYLNDQCPYFQEPFMDESDRDTLNREIARLVENNCLSILSSRLSTAYNLGLINLSDEASKQAWQDYLQRGQNFNEWQKQINATTGKTLAGNQASDATRYYLNKVRSAIKSYEYKTINNELEQSIVSGGLEDLYYVPSSIAQNLFTVSHILISFTDEQKAEYKKITAEADKNPSYNPQPALNRLYASCSSNGKNVFDIYNEVKASLDNAGSLQQKYDLFRDFIYQYNSDPGMQNPKYEYLMSTNSENNTMVESFTQASIALKKNEDGLGGKGAISGIVWSDYGAHIIMYTRDINEFIWTGSENLLDLNYGDTLFAPMTAYGNQTRFDTYVSYFGRNYTNYRAHLLADYKNNDHGVTIVKSAFKDFI